MTVENQRPAEAACTELAKPASEPAGGGAGANLAAAVEEYLKHTYHADLDEALDTFRALSSPASSSPAEERGPYTCIRCLESTFNDDDVCDTCKAEALPDGVEVEALAKAASDEVLRSYKVLHAEELALTVSTAVKMRAKALTRALSSAPAQTASGAAGEER